MNKLVTVNTMTSMATVNHLKNRKSLTMTLKKAFLLCVTACLPAFAAMAQKIAVVNPAGASTLYQDLNIAIAEAPANSAIYLSAGGFQISDTTRIRKKLTINGIGHRADINPDGNTTVGGNFYFEQGADGSALMGVYLTGNVNIGTSFANGTFINGFLLRFCNVNSVQVQHQLCTEIVINQNYVRSSSGGGNSNIQFTNNILHSISNVNSGKIEYNTIIGNASGDAATWIVSHSSIVNNVTFWAVPSGSGNQISNNLRISDADIVGPNNGVDVTSNFRLASGNNAIGIYGGTGFSDSQLPPGPRIINRNIPSQTDANGVLRVQIEVSVE